MNWIIYLACMLFGTSTIAEESQKAMQPRIELKLRVDTRSRTTEVKPIGGNSTTSDYLGIELHSLNLRAKGKITDRTSYMVDLKGEQTTSKNEPYLRGSTTSFKFAVLSHKITERLSLGVGRLIVKRGGWYSEKGKYNVYRYAAINRELPLRFQTGMEAVYKVNKNRFDLQILNSNENKQDLNLDQKGKHMSIQARYKGTFGSISPLISYGISKFTSTDGTTLKGEEHTNTNTSFGIKFERGKAKAIIDYMISVKEEYDSVTVANDNSESLTTNSKEESSGLVIAVIYRDGPWGPLLKYSSTTKDVGRSSNYRNSDIILGTEYYADPLAGFRYSFMLIQSTLDTTDVNKTVTQDLLFSVSAHVK